MPPFTSHPLRRHPIHERLRKHPSLFGIPFVLIVVGASFGLSSFTQTKYELHDKKIQNVRMPHICQHVRVVTGARYVYACR